MKGTSVRTQLERQRNQGWWNCRLFTVVVLGTLATGLAGCGSQTPYPETKVRSPVGREGVCFACQKKIASVSQANLVTVGAVQFIVCDEKCAAQAKAKAQDE